MAQVIESERLAALEARVKALEAKLAELEAPRVLWSHTAQDGPKYFMGHGGIPVPFSKP